MRQLTEKQQKFLNVLFSEAGGDMSRAIKLAGYAEHTTPSQIVKALKEEILEKAIENRRVSRIYTTKIKKKEIDSAMKLKGLKYSNLKKYFL